MDLQVSLNIQRQYSQDAALSFQRLELVQKAIRAESRQVSGQVAKLGREDVQVKSYLDTPIPANLRRVLREGSTNESGVFTPAGPSVSSVPSVTGK